MESKDIRWVQRFQNFEKAFLLLQNTFHDKPIDQFSDLEQEGVIQRFEYTFELAWKTIKDYLESTGIILQQITPKTVLQEAISTKVIDAEFMHIWMDMLKHRNLMSHTYDKKVFQLVVIAIKENYLEALSEMYLFLKEKVLEK